RRAFSYGLGGVGLPCEKGAQLVVRLRELWVVLERFLQIFLSVLQARQLDEERAQVEGGPGRRRAARAVQPNGILICMDGLVVSSQGLIAETEVVIGFHKTRIERGCLTGVGDGGAELLRVVVEA